MYLSPTYLIFALPALLLGLYAQAKVKSSFSKYLKVRNARGITGLQAAQQLLATANLSHISIEGVRGNLTDHYDPRRKTLRLSQAVANNASIASVAVVAHEVGHAVQDATDYTPMRVRSGLVPVVNIGSWLGPILFFLGWMAANSQLAVIGLVGFSGAAVFALVTLPVELDASSRALAMLESSGIIMGDEAPAARSVLNAAALTYIAALIQAISTLLYYASLLGGMRRD